MDDELLDRVGKLLATHDIKLVLAESMTAGALAATFSLEENAGDYLMGSQVCYSDEMKQMALGIRPALLDTFGGVSAEVTEALVSGLQRKFPQAKLLVAVTGFAFDCEATTRENPVGTVYVHIRFDRLDYARKYIFDGDKSSIIQQAIAVIIQLLDELLAQFAENTDHEQNDHRIQ